MHRSPMLLAPCSALIALGATDAAAQNPQTRDGFFIGFGLGVGTFGCEGCDSRQTGGAAHIKLGGTLNPRLLLGGESAAWTYEEGGARLTHVTVTGFVQFYPSEENGFFLKGGVGFSNLEASLSGGGTTVSGGDSGAGFALGLGYDIRVGTNFSVTPYGHWGFGDHGGSVNTAQAGVGVTWH